jgi:DNA-binding transcriptional MerR regulator
MRISELARTADLTVATVKYYLREGLLPAGRRLSATQADYDDSHLARLRLIRALVEVAGLPLASVRQVLGAIDGDPDDVMTAVGTAHDALGRVGPATADEEPPERALAALERLEWSAYPQSSAVRQLDAALAAAAAVGLAIDDGRLRAYADAALAVAREDIASVPSGSPEETAAYVVLGTVLYEPILLALRRLAQQQLYTG